jgi:hypothetical protein
MNRHAITAGLVSCLLLAGTELSRSDDAPGKAPERPVVPQAPQPARNVPAGAKREPGKVEGIPKRDPKADAKLIDLTPYYTLALDEDASGQFGYSLAMLPQGVQTLNNVAYDLRGVVQLSSRVLPKFQRDFPTQVLGIKVGQKCHTLNFLHASRWTEQNGTTIAKYVVHYANGQSREIPLHFGAELRDWRPMHDPEPRVNGPVVAWHGLDDGKLEVVLFQTTWNNPLPDVEVESVDAVSTMTDAALFLVGITAQ